MKRFKMLSVFLCMAVGMLGFAPAWGVETANVSLSGPPSVGVKGTFDLSVVVDNPKTLCGVALTVNYDSAKLDILDTENAVITTDALNSTGDIPKQLESNFFEAVYHTGGTDPSAFPRIGNVVKSENKIKLSGAYISSTGVGAYTTGPKNLFVIRFKVKDEVTDGSTLAFSLEKTKLFNYPAGWYTDANNNGQYDAGGTEDAPVEVHPLVGVPDDWTPTSAVQFENITTVFTHTPLDDTTKFKINVTKDTTQQVGLPAVGWHLVSFNVQPTDTTTAKVLEPIAGKYNIVWGYIDGGWKSYNPIKPSNLLTTMEANRGYWIDSKEAIQLPVTGGVPAKDVNLSQSWNLIGFPGTAETDITTALANIVGKYNIVWGYIDGGWQSYNPIKPSNLLTKLNPGYGYWIDMKENSVLTFP